MSDVDIRLNRAGVRAIFKSGECKGALMDEALKVANRVNAKVNCPNTSKPHYFVTTQTGEVSSRALVITGSLHARRIENKYHYLKNSL